MKPYSRMETTRDLKSLYFVWKLMEMLVHNLLSLAITAVTLPWQFLIRPQPYWCHPWTGLRQRT
ncbi:hypothetical protein DPMN_184637 [Dreissena polymorpha]|uniref:Uncharacterized protein n=1 Tax=Dreissena polymorpha TaxID=45954 RepID=A0A9D4DKF0_DREPO|nr:hypothetical protein DPMN_184637 [Dreissena polymorpha]